MSVKSSNNHTDLHTGSNAIPFLRWPGGKRWLVPSLLPIVTCHLKSRYYEPFLGGAALFFALNPNKATLSDLNPDVANVYRQVRDHPNTLIKKLKVLSVDKKSYYAIRESSAQSAIDRAVRFLYLNRTAFSGLYRLNRAGRFNVPYGGGSRTHRVLWQKGLITTASQSLKGKEITACDFAQTLQRAKSGDVVYCDPAYTVMHGNNGFRRYNESIFSWADQERLASAAIAASQRGAFVVVSNAYHKSLRKLYSTASSTRIKRASCLSPNAKHRGEVYEYLFVLPPGLMSCAMSSDCLNLKKPMHMRRDV